MVLDILNFVPIISMGLV